VRLSPATSSASWHSSSVRRQTQAGRQADGRTDGQTHIDSQTCRMADKQTGRQKSPGIDRYQHDVRAQLSCLVTDQLADAGCAARAALSQQVHLGETDTHGL
jgi:hypothetical protein